MATESLEKSTENLGKSIGEIFDAKNRYIIPLYQRNYAWGEVQIEALIQDIYEAYNMSKTGNYYIGSLVVLKRRNGDYEVIDGQQRLTTLSLITKLLGITQTPVLTYESRPEVELFFKEFYELDIKKMDIKTLETDLKTKITSSPQTFYLREAINVIKDAKINKDGDDKTSVGIEKWSEEIKEYLEKNVILVRVEIPEDTDVASYFEIMNNRGEQLQKHEILKARLMNALEPKYHTEFDLIWTACSNIDTPIQQCFGSKDRKEYFGENYDTFTFGKLSDEYHNDASSDSQQPTSINAILETAEINEIENDKKGDNAEKDRDKISSIIDFPNFLMHVLKLYAKKKSLKDIDVKLNEKFLLSCAEKLFGLEPDKDKVMDFIALLFKCRTLFDRYVIKIKGVEDDEEFSWVLNKPNKYTYSDGKNSVKYDINTYADELQSQVIMAQSMLQVTFRQRIYKNWLQSLLKCLIDQECELQKIQAESILECLHNYMEEHYNGLGINFDEEIELGGEKYKCLNMGVNTPHFLLNFIDYLYWVKQEVHSEHLSHKIKDFKFRYWNSVEHHLAQNTALRKGEKEPNLVKIVDCLGNLFMISKNANSRLNDRDVKEKVEMSKEANMGANRQIIYEKTKGNNNNWDEKHIKDHYKELRDLLDEKDKLLK